MFIWWLWMKELLIWFFCFLILVLEVCVLVLMDVYYLLYVDIIVNSVFWCLCWRMLCEYEGGIGFNRWECWEVVGVEWVIVWVDFYLVKVY